MQNKFLKSLSLYKWKFLLILFTSVLIIAPFILWWSIPSSEEIRGCITTKMYSVRLCPKESSYTPISQISTKLKKAVLVSEDSTFYQHQGFNWESIQNSIETDWKKGKFARGGSTITQQLAKNMFLTKDKTIWRKFREALITIKIEKTLSKNEILERYLNVVQFGKNIFGVKKAAQFYFGKSPSQLSLSESAFLALLLPSPEKYSISFYKKELTRYARKRMNFIIQQLYQAKMVSEEDYQVALSQLQHFPNSRPSVQEMLQKFLSEDGENDSKDGPNGETSDGEVNIDKNISESLNSKTENSEDQNNEFENKEVQGEKEVPDLKDTPQAGHTSEAGISK